MVSLTIELIRKRAEHNEGEISTLEEIALHQENIEKIETLNQACRNLKILLMQNNLIAKIENLNMLKKLEYLNLALNNIEVIENLQGLESLKKLDLTVNFIGDLTGVKRLRCNENLEQLFLTGNPCTDYPEYREYVVATLPQLKELDMTQIERSERIVALQNYPQTSGDVIRAYRNYARIREKQIDRHREKESLKITELNDQERMPNENNANDEQDENSRFWNGTSYHTPEDRLEIAARSRKRHDDRAKTMKPKSESNYVPKLFNSEGRAYNINQAKVRFLLNDETDRDNVVLEIAVYRHLDTAHIDIDVQPYYVRVTIKRKILQLSLSCEVSVGGSNAKRNVTTGSLVIIMPRLNPLPTIVATLLNDETRVQPTLKTIVVKNHQQSANKVVRRRIGPIISKRELLEIGPRGKDVDDMDFSRIYKDERAPRTKCRSERTMKNVSENFVDDPEVPPLE